MSALPKPLVNAVLVLVSLVWAGNFAASVFVPTYHSDASINFVFATIVGGAMAIRGSDQGGVIARLAAGLRAVAPPPPPAPGEPAAPAQPEVPK